MEPGSERSEEKCEEDGHPGEARSTAASSHLVEAAEVPLASFFDAPRTPLKEGVPGMSYQEEALEKLSPSAGLETLWLPPRSVWGQGSLGVSTETVCPTIQSHVS